MLLTLSMAAALSSCEKATLNDPEATPLPRIVSNMEDADFRERMRFFNGVDYCYNWQGNCLPEIIVVSPSYRTAGPSKRVVLDERFKEMSGSPKKVQAFFNGAEWATHFPVLNEKGAQSFLARLRSGKCDIKRIDYDSKSFYYAGAGELSPSHNEMVLEVTYAGQ